jgi:hypothetical protein
VRLNLCYVSPVFLVFVFLVFVGSANKSIWLMSPWHRPDFVELLSQTLYNLGLLETDFSVHHAIWALTTLLLSIALFISFDEVPLRDSTHFQC